MDKVKFYLNNAEYIYFCKTTVFNTVNFRLNHLSISKIDILINCVFV